MKLGLRQFMMDSNLAKQLVDAVVKGRSSIMLAGDIEEMLVYKVYYIDELNSIRANLFESPEALSLLRFPVYDREQLLYQIQSYFSYNDSESNIHSLGDDDFIGIANTRYPKQYDRCLPVKVECFLGRYDVKLEYKVVVRKGFNLKNASWIDFDYFCELEKKGDILIVEISSEKPGELVEYLKKINRDNWLKDYDRTSNQWYEYFVSYIFNSFTPQFMDRCMEDCIRNCHELFEIPDDDALKKAIESYEKNKVFADKSIEECVEWLKKNVNETRLLEKAISIIICNSKYYEHIMTLSQELGSRV